MDATGILELVDQLDDEVDDLEESLAPLVQTALSESASKLPLLDRAKLYVLVTYAIESILFSYLRINGVKARDHPVFKELTRVKQYFDKIKALETPAVERTMAVDKGAAARFIKAGLAGNDKYDLERAEREAKERARAQLQLERLNQGAKKRNIEESQSESSESSDSSSDEDEDEDQSLAHDAKKQKIAEPETDATSSNTNQSSSKKKSGKSQVKEVSKALPKDVGGKASKRRKKGKKEQKKSKPKD